MNSIRRGVVQCVSPAVIEALPPRVLLSNALLGSTLRIDGTEGDDVIIVGLNKRFINILTVFDNDQQRHYALSAISMIDIRALGGDDKVYIDSALDPLAYPSFIEGGDGNDSITTGAGKDTIRPGNGADKIYSNAGDDSIDGAGGNDSIWSGDGADLVFGGAGNDRISGQGGNDVINSGKGNDFVDGGDGHDQIVDPAGHEEVIAGAGNDSGNVQGTGIVRGGDGNDAFVSPGGAALYGDAGNDNLQSSYIEGGDDADTLSGLLGDDEIHGGAGDDLIRGFDGRDRLFGDDGDDALFGGGDNDTIYGGAGDDNLYGTDGHLDKHPELAGRDDGFGQEGSDWFETGYWWNRTDRRDGNDRDLGVQNDITVDPSYGYYGSSGITGATLNFSWGGDVYSHGTYYPLSSIDTKSLGDIGWISSGVYDTTAEKFVPPPMPHTERMRAKRLVVQLPQGWNVGEASFARDDIVWYRVTRDGATAEPVHVSSGTRGLALTDTSATNTAGIINVSDIFGTGSGTLTKTGAGTLTLSGSGTTTSTTTTPDPRTWTVPTLAGSTTALSYSTPGLFDGVEDARYRFLGVKRGTIVVSDTTVIGDPLSSPLTSNLLAINTAAEIRVAGYERVYQLSTSYDTVPTGGPKRLRGILVDGGAIWLPTDGSEPYFSSGRN